MSPPFHSFSPASWPPHPSCCLPAGPTGRGGGVCVGGQRGPAATSHSAVEAGRGSHSSPLLRWAFWPLRVEGWRRGAPASLMPPAPPVWPQAQECDRLDTQTQIHTSTLAIYCWMTSRISPWYQNWMTNSASKIFCYRSAINPFNSRKNKKFLFSHTRPIIQFFSRPNNKYSLIVTAFQTCKHHTTLSLFQISGKKLQNANIWPFRTHRPCIHIIVTPASNTVRWASMIAEEDQKQRNMWKACSMF